VINGEVAIDVRAFVSTAAEVNRLGGQVTLVRYLPVAAGMPGVDVQAMLPIGNLPALGRLADVVSVTPQYRVGPAGTTALSITTNPIDQAVVAGAHATFTVAASGVATPTVQWQVSSDGGKVFRNIPGATSQTLTFTAITGQSGNEYRAVFTNELGRVSTTAATLTVRRPIASNALSGIIRGTYVVPPTTLDGADGSVQIITDAGIRYDLSGSGALVQMGPVHAASELTFGGLGSSHGGMLVLSSAGGTVTLLLESQSVSRFSSLPQSFDFGVQSATGIYAGLSVHGTVTIALTHTTTSTSNDAPHYGNFTLTIRVGPPANAGVKKVVLAGPFPH
jgi:Immunoglobulin I-set domain